MNPTISCAFDSGAIEVVSGNHAGPGVEFTLRIRQDSHAEFRQWFHFRLSDARGRACSLRFENAGACTYPGGWKDYRAVASYDREHWFRVPTEYDGTVMTIAHTPERDAVWYAYFEPYSWERHQALVGRAGASALARVERLGSTVEGRDLDLVTVCGVAVHPSTSALPAYAQDERGVNGTQDERGVSGAQDERGVNGTQHERGVNGAQHERGVNGTQHERGVNGAQHERGVNGAQHERKLKTIWVIARQHPGESMAEWFVEGMIERLLDHADPVSRRLLERAVVHVVPNMNPDGSVRGNLRTNAAGANLNREWMNPSMESSPEVFHVRERIQKTGADVFLDVHGDEALPYVFVAGGEMLPGFTPEQSSTQKTFIADFKRASPDFQDVHGYGAGKYHADALKLASKWVGHTFGCLSLTLEMPFKDNADLPDAQAGWSGERSRKLGAAMVEPLLAAIS